MIKLDEQALKSLKYGDRVYRFGVHDFRGLKFVAKMPGNENYLIFCDGDYLTTLFIDKKGGFSYEWYGGKYSSEFVGNLKLAQLESEKESIEKIYFKIK